LKQAKCLSATFFIVAFMFGGAVCATAQSEISLLAPNPTRVALSKIVPKFEEKTGLKVKVTYGGARTTTQRVAHGDPLDVSLVVAPVTGVQTSGAVIPGSMTLVASYQIAVAVPNGAPKPDISTRAAVKKVLLAAKSIGYEDPEFATSGQAPAEAIKNLGIAEQIVAKSKVCANNTTYMPNSVCFDPAGTGRGAAGAVRTTQKGLISGDIAIGLLYLSDILPDKDKFTIVGVLPREIYTPTGIVGFISTHAADPAGAKALLQYLISADAQAIFKEAGFEQHK
jgi:molybdate transport system substrate-binding protein